MTNSLANARWWASLSLLTLTLATGIASADPYTEASRDPRWLRLYQYSALSTPISSHQYKSDVESQNFFFSPEGPTNPLAEMRAAIDAYNFPTRLYGTLQLPAACAFPLRKKILEQLTKTTFPNLDCKELKDWMGTLSADQVSIVFVGAYAGNAASILGHTFLRFSNSKKEISGHSGMELLSYSVGYTAHSDPNDGRISYVFKGLTGAYPGFYDIEPYYMKVGLYNNSESRDLWISPLDFSPKETEDLLMLVWEHTFNAQIPYYFIGKNCSYRLLKLLEAIRPDLQLSQDFHFVVLPAETVRVMKTAGIASKTPHFRASVQRRMELKLQLLNKEERLQFRKAIESTEEIPRIESATLMDALLDYWLHANYKAQTQLPLEQQQIMDATLERATQLTSTSQFILNNEQIREQLQLEPPFLGHKPHWLELESGVRKDSLIAGGSFRYGVHPVWSADRGYQDVSMIEYLGVDYKHRAKEKDRWNFLFVQAQTLEDFWGDTRKASWGVGIRVTNDCALCGTDRTQLQISGSYGLSTRQHQWLFAFLPDLKTALWHETDLQAMAAPGARSLVRWSQGNWLFYAEASSHWRKSQWTTDFESRLGYSVSRDQLLFLKARKDEALASYVWFF